MRKLFPLLVAAMMLSLAACGGPVTISSAAAGPGQEVVFQKDEGDEYIDPQLLTGLTEDGEDYFLLSGNEPSQAVQTGGGYAAAALSAHPNLSLLVPNSGGEIARSLTQDTAILSRLGAQQYRACGTCPKQRGHRGVGSQQHGYRSDGTRSGGRHLQAGARGWGGYPGHELREPGSAE